MAADEVSPRAYAPILSSGTVAKAGNAFNEHAKANKEMINACMLRSLNVRRE